MSIFGEWERLAGDLEPYRWQMALGALLAVGSVATSCYRVGWPWMVRRHLRPVLVVLNLAPATLIPLGNDPRSPL